MEPFAPPAVFRQAQPHVPTVAPLVLALARIGTMTPRSKLTLYQEKRDFQKTAEPSGDETPVLASDASRFVVQRHDATRLHYDLRLELDGVFKSWAVTRGPSLNPADKRLAVEVEDHPLAYGDFEGTIPKGQYGGGTVQLFDRGTWEPEGHTSPAKALADGELKFTLHGKRLKGSFVLVRLRRDRTHGKRTNWLLIKHRDDEAREGEDGGGIQSIETSVASGRTLEEIAAGKGRAPKPFMLPADLAPTRDAVWNSKEGLAAEEREAPKSRTKARRVDDALGGTVTDTMPEFVEPQLCTLVAKAPSGAGWLHEVKFDGYRAQIRVEDGAATIRTRNGLDWTDKFPALAASARKLPDCLMDGEIVAVDAAGHPSFSALQAAIADQKTNPLVFFAFDLLFAEGRDLRASPLHVRKAALRTLLSKRRRPAANIRYVEHFEADGPQVFASAKDLGLEGIVSKKVNGPYRSGRAESWTKAKSRAGHEFVIGAWTETNGKFRSLLGGVFEGDKLIYVGRIGTGFSAANVARLLPRLQAHARKTSPFAPKSSPGRGREIHWVDPVLVAEVEFAGWSSDGLVRQASFKDLREDKPARSVTAERPVRPTAAASLGKGEAPAALKPPVKGKAPAASNADRVAARGASRWRSPLKPRSGKVAVMGVTITHPEKPLWPDDGAGQPVTKLELAQYFEAVGAWMLPHLEGRPCSIIRAPDGIEGERFFQRHFKVGDEGHYHTIEIAGDRQPYLVIDDVAALAAVAQSGGVELHPLNSLPGHTDIPGRLVFDLDPAPDVPFAEVVAAAKLMRARLDALGLDSFCKTTGGKGLHVVVPLAAEKNPVNWDEAKRFARDVCVGVEREMPTKFLTKMSKAARTGRIFLDYLRNDRLSTAVGPLSPRARPHAPVSMPLTWAQVKADLDPQRYTLRTVPKLLAKSKAWEGYDEAARPLTKAIKALAAAGK